MNRLTRRTGMVLIGMTAALTAGAARSDDRKEGVPARAEKGMVYIPGGKCRLGIRPEQQERIARAYGANAIHLAAPPERVVDLPPYYKDDLPVTHETCFQTAAAPNFRDHDGHRTLLTTEQGFRPVTAIRHPVNPRLWCQEFVLADQARLQ